MKRTGFIYLWIFTLLGVLALVGIAGVVEPETKSAIFKEGGLVESLSAAGYFIGFALLLFQIIKHRYAPGWSLCVILLCFGFRELDFDKRFTTMGIFKSRFYSSSEVLVSEKMIGVLITVALLVCVYFLIRTYSRPFFESIKKKEAHSLTVFIALALLVVAKSLDGIGRKLEPFGITATQSVRTFSGILEESLELMAPFLLIAAITALFQTPAADLGDTQT